MSKIVQATSFIVTFIQKLCLDKIFTNKQIAYFQLFFDGITGISMRKTLAQISEMHPFGPDESNFSDFLRTSPWNAKHLYMRSFDFVINFFKEHPELRGQTIRLTIDDSIVIKDKGTHALETVDWSFDHTQKRYTKGCTHIVLRIHCGIYHFPIAWRIYLPESVIRRRNKKKDKNHPPRKFRSKYELAKEMLQEIYSSIPHTGPVYVMFDSWYASNDLLKWIRQHDWHVIAAIKSNRSFKNHPVYFGPPRYQQLNQWNHDLKHQPYDTVNLRLANGQNRQYYTRRIVGKLKRLSGDVCVIISKKGKRDSSPKYFISTDTKLDAQQILQMYQSRWNQEVDYWYVKQAMGLGDFRVQSIESIEKWYAIQYTLFIGLYWISYQSIDKETKKPLRVSEVLYKIRQEQTRHLILQVFREGKNNSLTEEEVVARYLGSSIAMTA